MFYTKKQLAATSTGYFNQTTLDFRRIEQSHEGVQWAFYSAHDTTLGNFLARLNLTNVDCLYANYLKGKRYNN